MLPHLGAMQFHPWQAGPTPSKPAPDNQPEGASRSGAIATAKMHSSLVRIQNVFAFFTTVSFTVAFHRRELSPSLGNPQRSASLSVTLLDRGHLATIECY